MAVLLVERKLFDLLIDWHIYCIIY